MHRPLNILLALLLTGAGGVNHVLAGNNDLERHPLQCMQYQSYPTRFIQCSLHEVDYLGAEIDEVSLVLQQSIEQLEIDLDLIACWKDDTRSKSGKSSGEGTSPVCSTDPLTALHGRTRTTYGHIRTQLQQISAAAESADVTMRALQAAAEVVLSDTTTVDSVAELLSRLPPSGPSGRPRPRVEERILQAQASLRRVSDNLSALALASYFADQYRQSLEAQLDNTGRALMQQDFRTAASELRQALIEIRMLQRLIADMEALQRDNDERLGNASRPIMHAFAFVP